MKRLSLCLLLPRRYLLAKYLAVAGIAAASAPALSEDWRYVGTDSGISRNAYFIDAQSVVRSADDVSVTYQMHRDKPLNGVTSATSSLKLHCKWRGSYEVVGGTWYYGNRSEPAPGGFKGSIQQGSPFATVEATLCEGKLPLQQASDPAAFAKILFLHN